MQIVPFGNETALQYAVFKSTVAVFIDASHNSFQFYSGGVYYEPDCSTKELDHQILATGWGVDSKGNAYWIVRNR